MPSSYSPNLRFIEQATGENANTWGSLLNTGMIALVDNAVAGITPVGITGATYDLTVANGATDQSRYAILNVTGALAQDSTIVTATGASKIYIVANNTTGNHTLSMAAAPFPGGTTIAIPQGSAQFCYTDGTNFYTVGNNGLAGNAVGPIHMLGYLFDQPLIKRYSESYNAMGSVAGTVNLDYNNGNYQSLTLTSNVTLNLVNWPASGTAANMTLFCTQDSAGSRILSFTGAPVPNVLVPGGGGLILSSAPNAVDEVLITTFDGGVTLYCAILRSFS